MVYKVSRMVYIEHDRNDLFVLSQKVLACLLREIQEIPSRVRILMFVESSYYLNGLNRRVEKHLSEIIDDDRRLSAYPKNG